MKPSTKIKVFNFLLFQIGWFSCVLGAANALPWLGVAVVAITSTIHLTFFRRGWQEAVLLVSALLVGIICDLAVIFTGHLGFPDYALLAEPLPIWMPMMWVNFAMTLHLSMGWLKGRYLLAAALGVIGGPTAYWPGERFGAVLLADPLWESLLVIAIEWAIAMPILLWLAAKFDVGQTVPLQEGDVS